MNAALVIFDCDGVLVDSEPIANRVFAEQLAAAGLHMPVEEVMARFVGRTKEGCIELATSLLGRELPPGFGERWDTVLYETLEREVRAVEGVTDLLDRLQIPFCVASNSTVRRLKLSLEATGLAPRFAGRMFSAEAVARPKPAPDLFLHAAAAMKTPPAKCVVIEDTPTGVQAGVAAGMTVLGFAARGPQQREALQARGATTFESMAQVPDLLPRDPGR